MAYKLGYWEGRNPGVNGGQGGVVGGGRKGREREWKWVEESGWGGRRKGGEREGKGKWGARGSGSGRGRERKLIINK